MRRPERSAACERLGVRDIEPLNRLFSDAFTDRYGRDGMTGIRVPFLNPAVWRYALEAAGDGALGWRDADGRLVAFNMVHLSGTEGWMGPLAVRPDRQGAGLGREVVQTGIDFLRQRGARIVGLETMPRTVENIGFYSRLGFVPGHLTITLVHDAERQGERSRSGGGAAPGPLLDECRALALRLQPGSDFERELALTHELDLGGVTAVRRDGGLEAFALWHAAPLASGRPRDELRVLKAAACSPESFRDLMRAVRRRAGAERVRRISLRCQTDYATVYQLLVADGFRVHWTDLRMVLAGTDGGPAGGGVVMSNWEI